MNRTQTILAAVGGVALVAVLAAGYFAWCQLSAKTAALEGDDEGAVGLESVRDKAERLSRKSVYPDAESVKTLEGARESLQAWKEEAFALASRGDRRLPRMTGAAFKEFVVTDARRLQALPAGKDAKTLDPAFDFGLFKPYVSEDKTPEEKAVVDLQRKWDDIAALIETLSAAGVTSLTSVEVKTASEKPAEEEAKTKPKAKGKARAKGKAKAAEAPASRSAACTYVVTCKTHPAALARVLNALATSERFMVVDDFSVRREKDTVAEALGAAEKKDDAAAPAGGRRRRRGAAVEKQAAETEKKSAEEALFAVVADPVSEQPLEVRMTVTVHDFRTLDEKKEEGEVEK